MTDQQIIELLKANRTSKAFSRLYRYLPPVQKMILSRGGSKNDALDIYQDALVILCKKVQENNFTLTSSLDTYLYSVCRFLWSDECKRKGRQPEHDLNDEINLSEEELHSIHEQEQHLTLAETALGKLGQKCLQLLQLFYVRNLDMKTIAKKMEFTSQGAAKNQKYKCLEKAKQLYQAEQTNLKSH